MIAKKNTNEPSAMLDFALIHFRSIGFLLRKLFYFVIQIKTKVKKMISITNIGIFSPPKEKIVA
ncbi:hypothetical protein JS80_14830 [Anoxybacillus sp. KU2-6(11)]|nr:hypothetical protein JS80_14830 [Anoxybacillus sp. KU2-6(11)]